MRGRCARSVRWPRRSAPFSCSTAAPGGAGSIRPASASRCGGSPATSLVGVLLLTSASSPPSGRSAGRARSTSRQLQQLAAVRAARGCFALTIVGWWTAGFVAVPRAGDWRGSSRLGARLGRAGRSSRPRRRRLAELRRAARRRARRLRRELALGAVAASAPGSPCSSAVFVVALALSALWGEELLPQAAAGGDPLDRRAADLAAAGDRRSRPGWSRRSSSAASCSRASASRSRRRSSRSPTSPTTSRSCWSA